MGRKNLFKETLWFRKDSEERCQTINAHLTDMNDEGSDLISLYKAFPDTDLFFCPALDVVAERNTGMCGKVCPHYTPRNGKNGICKHNRTAYTAYPKVRYVLSKEGILHGPVSKDYDLKVLLHKIAQTAPIVSLYHKLSAIKEAVTSFNQEDPDRSLF